MKLSDKNGSGLFGLASIFISLLFAIMLLVSMEPPAQVDDLNLEIPLDHQNDEGKLNKKTAIIGNDLALFPGTSSYYAWYDDYPIHYGPLHQEKDYYNGLLIRDLFLEGWDLRGEKPVALWFGNSQLNGINDYKVGEKNGPEYLFEMLREQEIEPLTLSLPNLRPVEILPLYIYFREHLKIETLIIGLTFSDLRFSDIRTEMISYLNDKAVQEELSKTEIGKEILLQSQSESNTGDSELAGLAKTLQEIVEKGIVDYLSEKSTLWAGRPVMRQNLIRALYKLRNFTLNISPYSKRPIVYPNYLANIASLEETFKSAKNSGLDVIIYIAPVRSDVERPYLRDQYVDYKSEVSELASKYGCVFRDYDEIIPGELYGEKMSTNIKGDELEIDFKHFTSKAHKILADSLYSLMESKLIKETTDAF